MESLSDTSFLTETRPLGMVEESWTKGICGGTGITVLGALFNRLLHGHHICAAVQHLLDLHPLLRSQIVENVKSKLWIEVADSCPAATYVNQKTWPFISHDQKDDYKGAVIFPKDRHDKHGSLALHKIINEELNLNFLNDEGKPQMPMRVFHVNFYPNKERQQTVIALKFNGGMLDRPSACAISQSFFSHLGRSVGGTLGADGKRSNAKRPMEEAAILPAVEDLIPKAKASKSFWQKGVEAAGYAVYAKIYSLLPFQPGYSSSRFSISAWSKKSSFESNVVSLNLGKHATASVFDACERAGISFRAALSAAFLKTVASLKELKKKKLDEFTYMCILDCRDRLEPKLCETALGNYSLGIPQHEKVKEDIDFWEYARHIDASVKKDIAKSKHFTELPVLGFLFSYVMKHPYLTPSSSMRTALMALSEGSTTEKAVRRWNGGEEEGGELEMVGTLGPFASMHYVGPCFFLAETVLEGPELVISVIYPTPVYGRDQILDLLHSSAEMLRNSCSSLKP